jgi:putative ABC transport system permease protein
MNTGRPRTTIQRLTGMGLAGTGVLALLAFGCVLAAAAGPRQALATRTQALHQTLGATSPLDQAIVTSSTWTQLTGNMTATQGNGQPTGNITESQLREIGTQLHGDFNRGIVQLAPRDEDWASMTSSIHDVLGTVPAVGGNEVKLEVTYRQPFTEHTKLIAGHYPGAAGAAASGYVPTLQVAVTPQTARRFGLHPGSRLRIAGPQLPLSGQSAAITLDVSGIVAPRDPGSTFWMADPAVVTPELQPSQPPFWVGGVFAGSSEAGAVQQDFGAEGLSFSWELPMKFGALRGDQAQTLHDQLNRLSSQTVPLTGDIAPAAGALTVTAGPEQPLASFIAAAQAVDALLWLVYVSLAVAGIVVLLFAARMVAMRRATEFTIRRSRGAALTQIALTAARGVAIACVPAAIIAAVLAVVLVPGATPGGGWWPGICTLALAVGGPAVIAVRQQRTPRRTRPGDRRKRLLTARLIAEVAAFLAAVAGIVVFRQQGTQTGGVDLYTSAAPVLVAVPVVIVVLRVYPLLLRALLRGSARGKGAVAFLGLARAARGALTPALPALALVLAVTVAAFAGMVRDAVTRGEVAASWQATGADVVISTAGSLTSAALRDAAAVPGVDRAADVFKSTWTAPDGQQITGLAVDPASYAALVASTQTWPAVNPDLISRTNGGVSVLASPEAVADLGQSGGAALTEGGIAPVRVRVVGVLSGTPALPGGGPFVIMPLSAIKGVTGPIPMNELLLTGTNIDSARLAAIVRREIPGGITTDRSDSLKALTGAPLQHGTFVLFALAIVVAAGLGLAVMLLELALGAAERESTLARLAAMGLGERQRARVVVLEVLPAVAVAAVAAVACALALPQVVAPSIDLSVFTGSAAGVTLTPDAASFLLPLAGLVVVAGVALAAEVRSARRRGVAGSLRAGG